MARVKQLGQVAAKMYEPTSGAIFVDDQPLHEFRPESGAPVWPRAFQDFYRFEFRAVMWSVWRPASSGRCARRATAVDRLAQMTFSFAWGPAWNTTRPHLARRG